MINDKLIIEKRKIGRLNANTQKQIANNKK